ncbi:MAG TPA: alpha-L-arabinofuranosidase C-terminal domain-containing protein [Candidatus Limnocylindrales bacterium]|nr:alpha-L-arabinofuranosidase C-terminal domain-containing protein [Candidatus Limnocylindrales bacterium]
MTVKDLGRRGFLKSGVAALGAAALPVASPALRWMEVTEAAEQAAAQQGASGALIKIDMDRKLGAIDRKIYGSFIEHLGRCIYGGVYDEGSPLSDSEGFRKDVLAAARGLRISILRWPGGNFSSAYDWKDGIGPKDARPRRWDPAWQEVETNRFGTDEFIQYCRKLGAEPYICVNMGTGTMEEAANWVEYCNATTDTYWANLRKKYGHAEPYGVKYWALGNEVWGGWQAGHMDAKDYAAAALEYGKMMRWVDPSIKLVASGDLDVAWDLPVLERLSYIVDYISVHHYGGSIDTAKEMQDAHHFQEEIQLVDSIITAAMSRSRRKERIKIAVDEWNIWFRSGAKRGDPHKLEEIYNLRDALWVASALNIFHRMCNTVEMANLAQLVNVIAPIMTNATGIVLQTIYYPFQLYAEHAGSVSLDAFVRSDTFPGMPGTPYIDVSATTDGTGQKLTLAVVNRHPTADIPVQIALDGFRPRGSGELYEVNGPSLDATNTFAAPNNVTVKRQTISPSAAKFQRTFPAHSVSVLALRA